VARNSTCKLGFPTFLLSVPFKVDNASAPIVVTAEIRMEKLLSIVSRASGFESYVVDAEGKVLVHPDEQFVFSRKDFSDLEIVQGMHLTGPRLPIAGTMEFSGYRDETYLGSYSPVGFAHLGMIVQKPKRAAYLAARELTRKSLISALLIILIATGVSFVFSRRLTGPIKKLSAETRRIAQGNFNVKLDIKSRDEIGDLASTFRDMAADLSAREKELKETFQQLAQSEKLAAIGQIGAGITHEIKNPLTGIIGFAQFSQRKLQEPAVVKKNLLIIEKEAKRCKEILENLLKFSRKEKTVFEPTDLNEIVLETIKLIDHQMGINNVRVKVKLESGIPRIMGNANQLQQVFMNMLINAQQAMEGGGEIVVTTTLVEDKAVISFRDTGKGIAQEELNRIFEPFYTTKGKGKGTGLGLTVSYGIIQQHKGRITVESEAGKGTNFCIALPASASEAVSQDPAELPAHISVAAPGTSADTVH
jgi:two-component system NtrC family sensor kinase